MRISKTPAQKCVVATGAAERRGRNSVNRPEYHGAVAGGSRVRGQRLGLCKGTRAEVHTRRTATTQRRTPHTGRQWRARRAHTHSPRVTAHELPRPGSPVASSGVARRGGSRSSFRANCKSGVKADSNPHGAACPAERDREVSQGGSATSATERVAVSRTGVSHGSALQDGRCRDKAQGALWLDARMALESSTGVEGQLLGPADACGLHCTGRY